MVAAAVSQCSCVCEASFGKLLPTGTEENLGSEKSKNQKKRPYLLWSLSIKWAWLKPLFAILLIVPSSSQHYYDRDGVRHVCCISQDSWTATTIQDIWDHSTSPWSDRDPFYYQTVWKNYFSTDYGADMCGVGGKEPVNWKGTVGHACQLVPYFVMKLGTDSQELLTALDFLVADLTQMLQTLWYLFLPADLYIRISCIDLHEALIK